MELTVTLMGMDWSTTNHIYNGNRTEWTPVWRVIPRRGNPICQPRVSLQTELDEMNSCYQLIKTMT